MRKTLSNIITLFIYYTRVYNVLNKKNIKNIKIYNFKKWHHGYGYLTGFLENKKIFIKFDTKLLLLQNDLLAYDILKKPLNKSLVKIYDSVMNDDIQIIFYEFLEWEELSSGSIVENPKFIKEAIDILVTLNEFDIIHRDIKLDNFFISDNQLKIIDFTFANSLTVDSDFKELDTSKLRNCSILESLGNNLNPTPFEWNDAISLRNSLCSLGLNELIEQYKEDIEYLIYKTYKVKCSKCYFKIKRIKKIIKNLIFIRN